MLSSAVFAPFLFLESDGKTWQGMSLEILNYIQEKLNFTYSVVSSPDGRFGSPTSDGGWDGEIGQLVRGEADMR